MFTTGKNSNDRRLRESRAQASSRVVGSVSWYQKSEVDAPGKSRESQILPSVREPTSSERETSLITVGFGIEFHPPPPVAILPATILRFECTSSFHSLTSKVSKVETRFLDEFLARARNRSGWGCLKNVLTPTWSFVPHERVFYCR